MSFCFQDALLFAHSLEEAFLVPRKFFNRPEEITSLFNKIVNRVANEQACSGNVLSFFPVFYALMDTSWRIDEKPIFSSMQGHYFRDLFELQDQMEKARGCPSISKSVLTLNGTEYDYCIKICCTNDIQRIVLERQGIMAFYVPSNKRLNLFINDTNFVDKYARSVLFTEDHISEEIKKNPLLHRLCKALFPTVTQHTVYLQQENDILYYVFSSSVADYGDSITLRSRYGLGGVFVVLRGEWGNSVFLEAQFIEKCRSIINRLSSCILIYFHLKLARANATKSAIGSIMSRNGSHNIGSHVLAALSHNAGTMPDDRVLYQYIQQRMDYIATVTTEFPNWTGPTRFVSNMMKTFLSQRHLLEHISESEGLGAWHFRGRQVSAEQTSKIRIHVRKVKWSGGNVAIVEKDFITYSGQPDKNTNPGLLDDVSLAIPGGTVGQHAFYTILENIIRNAAKHGWSKRSNDAKEKNLEIYIDFREKAESGEVEFTIWDNMSDVLAACRSNGSYTLTAPVRMALLSEQIQGLQDALSAFFAAEKRLGKFTTTQIRKLRTAPLGPPVSRDNLARLTEELIAERADKSKFALKQGSAKKSRSAKTLKGRGRPLKKKVGMAQGGAQELYGSLEVFFSAIGNLKKLLGEPCTWPQIAKLKSSLSKLTLTTDSLSSLVKELTEGQSDKLQREVSKFAGDKVAEENLFGGLTSAQIEKLQEAHSENTPDENRVNYDDLPQHWRQQILLEQPLIDDQGNLRRENWGLAEMRISAGYLQRRGIDEIGGIAGDKKKNDIITPVAVHEGTDATAKYHLGYRFTVPKPKKLLIVKPKNDDDWSGITSDEAMEKAGVYIKTITEIDSGGDKDSRGCPRLDYEYVVLPDSRTSFENEEKKWLLPFRVLFAEQAEETADDVVSYTKLKDIIGKNDSNKVNQIKKLVYDAWLAAIKSWVKTEDPIYLQVQAGSGASGGGKGLMRDSDLYRIVFRECGHSVLLEATKEQRNKTARLLTTLLAAMPLDQESFLEAGDGEESRAHIRKQLVHFCDRFKRELRLDSRAGIGANQDFIKCLRDLFNAPDTEITANNQFSGFELAFLRNLQLDLQGDNGLAKSRVKALIRYLVETTREKLNAALDVFCGKLEPSQVQSPDPDFSDIFDNDSDPSSVLRKNIDLLFGPADSDTSAEFGKLVDKLNSAYQTSDIFLRKYEEDIPTLPKIPWAKKEAETGSSQVTLAAVVDFDAQNPEPTQTIRYVRHDNTSGGLYAEALSGSQSYLSAMTQFSLSKIDFTVRLVENALLRVLLVDERVCNFFATRPEELNACRKMRIFAGDYAMADAERRARNGFVELKKKENTFGIQPGKYDILIIHQGVIDKWCSAHDKKAVGELLERLKGAVPFVVVTTGRGRPDNIPDEARVLPFTSVESTLFRKYPEKLVLVNTVMNILPTGKGTGS